MSPKIKNDPEVSISQSALQNMDQMSQSRHNQLVQGISNMAPRMIPDDELSSQDNFSLCSSTNQSHGTPGLKSWSVSDVDGLDGGVMSSVKPESPEVQMLSFSLSQQLMPSTVGPSDVMYHHSGPEFPSLQDMADQSELDFSHAQDFNTHYSSLVDFSAFDNDVGTQNGSQSCTSDDAHSVSHSSHTDDAWSLVPDNRNYPGSSMDHFTSSMFHPVPVSPPLTEASNDVSVTSSCSHSGYPAYMPHDDGMLKDVTATPVGQGINLGDPLFPLTPPLNEQDPNRSVLNLSGFVSPTETDAMFNRTIRPSKSARRPALQTPPSQSQVKQDAEFFPPLPVKEPLRQRSKEGAELRNPRDHYYYSLPTHGDGKYYCPFAMGDKPCNHPPTTQKCAYQ